MRGDRFRRATLALTVAILFCAAAVHAQRFYPDDPLDKEPAPLPAIDPAARQLSFLLEAFYGTFGQPGEAHPAGGVIPAQGLSTLGEVLDGPWFVNRHGRTRMSLDALRRGAGDDQPPSIAEPWRVALVHPQGIRPLIVFRDSGNRLYLLRFDPREAPEMATGAEMVSSRIFHALGYHVPESYLVVFDRDRLVVDENASEVTSFGTLRELTQGDIDRFLEPMARRPDARYRAVAHRMPTEVSAPIGPFQFLGTRSDDPNDIVSHEHRRELRGLHVFSGWLNHTRVSPLHTFDAVVLPEGEPPHVRHYLFDFMATLGSGLTRPKPVWEGRDPIYAQGSTLRNIVGLGLYTPDWMRARYPNLPAVGRFESDTFDPEAWTPAYYLAPFENRLPDDTFWAARQVMAFTDGDIRAIVEVAQYSDPEAARWIADSLIGRRDRITRTYFDDVLPLDGFAVRDGRLAFDDLAVSSGFAQPRSHTIEWRTFDNKAGAPAAPIGSPTQQTQVPKEAMNADYVMARVTAEGSAEDMAVSVYLRKEGDGLRVVGVDRAWPGRVLVNPRVIDRPVHNRYVELEPERQKLFDAYASDMNARTNRNLTPEEHFRSMTVSEQTTFDGVSHALMQATLTDEEGRSLGRALDLLTGVERIAGQYAGRSGDQQFRVYVRLRPDARDILERSREFVLGQANAVYHVGYPYSYRLGDGVPSIQFSVSEDGLRADVDVDYRASKPPQSLFNGHLTASNSDVRAGDNAQRHDRRWTGFASWWTDLFGDVTFSEREGTDGADPLAVAAVERPTLVPPNRAANASIPEVADAVQEFLSDWLIRRNFEEALAFFATDALGCVADSMDLDPRAPERDLRRAALRLLEQTADTWGPARSLTEAMRAVLPWSPAVRVLPHTLDREFALVEAPDELGAQYECGATPPQRFEPLAEPRYGTYYGALLQVVQEGKPGGTLVLVWRRVDEQWRLVAYRAVE